MFILCHKAGKILISCNNFKSKEINAQLSSLNRHWADLTSHSNDKGAKLRQAVKEHQLNRALEDAKENIDEMEKMLTSEDVGQDLRSVKALIKNQQVNTIHFTILFVCDRKLTSNDMNVLKLHLHHTANSPLDCWMKECYNKFEFIL